MIVLAASLGVISEYHEVNLCDGGGYMPVATVARYTDVVFMFLVHVSSRSSSVIESISPGIK